MATCPTGHESASTDFCDVCGIRIDAPPTPAPAPRPAPAMTAGSADTGTVGAGSARAGLPGRAGVADPAGQPCPRCGVPRFGQFCEACGHAFGPGTVTGPGQASPPEAVASAATPPPSTPASASWSAITGSGSAVPAPGTAGTALPSWPPRQPTGWTALVTADRQYYDRVVATGDSGAAAVPFPAYCPERRFALTAPEMQIGRHSAARGIQPEIDLTGPPTDPGVSRLHAVLIAEPDGSWAVLDPGSENGTLVNDTEVSRGTRLPLRDGDRIFLGAWTALTIQAP